MLANNEILQSRYRIVRQLGRGGMGAVYEAVDERFGTPVALKEILVELHDWADQKHKNSMMKAFEREAKSLAQARHEAVPFVRDYFSELDRQFLVMELVEGDDLAELLEKRGQPFPLEEVVNWADQLLDALDYLHNLQPPIIHRDIKPQNLKLSFRRKIKLLDFGIAKSGDGTQTMTNQTFVGATLNYSPIEQILRVIDPTFREFIKLKHREKTEAILNQNTDLRCDIYALGATFYHLLTNHPPMDSTTRTLEIWEGKTDPLPNPSELNPAVPPSISACLLKAMEIERANRFSSAVEMQTALQTLMTEERSGKEDAAKVLPSTGLPNDKTKIQAENNLYSKKPHASTQSSPVPPTEPQFTVPGALVGKSFNEKVPDTLPSGRISKSRLPETARLDNPLIYENKFNPALSKNSERKPGAKLFWILPTAAFCIVAVGGIGGMVWRNGLNTLTNANKSAANTVISTPTATATGLPTVVPNSLSPIPLPTPNISNKNEEKTKPATTPPPNQKPSQNPVKTSSPPKTPKPPPIKQNTGDDCIYNGKCS